MSLVVVGINHRSAPLGLLGTTAVGAEALPKALADLAGRGSLEEVVLLSTCMRTEVYASTSTYHAAVADIRDFVATWSGASPDELAGKCYDFHDAAAVAHLLQVAAGLDSAVLGEGEILRQVRGAWEAAGRERVGGPVLDGAFRRAVEAGKRVRAETAIARGTTSLSHTAVMLAGERLAADAALVAGGEPCPGAASLAGARAVVLGAGEMGAAVAALLVAGRAELSVASRGGERAAALASRLGARAVPWSSVAEELVQADLVVSATASPVPVLDAATVASAVADPARDPVRPLIVVDLAVPRDVDAEVADVEGVTVYDLDDLKASAESAMASRREEVPVAEAILAEELARWAGATAAREVTPVVAALHSRGEGVRLSELARLERRLVGLDDDQRRAVEALTRGIVAKLLHDPSVRLKATAAANPSRAQRLGAALDELFDLGRPPGGSAETGQ